MLKIAKLRMLPAKFDPVYMGGSSKLKLLSMSLAMAWENKLRAGLKAKNN
jgi:hypothetical protein